MRNLHKINILSLAMILVALGWSCNEDKILDITNRNTLNTDLIGEDITIAQSLVNGAYSNLQHRGLYGRFGHWLEDHMSDELQAFTNSADPDIFQISNYSLVANSTASTEYFRQCYQGIGNCNVVISSESQFADFDETATSHLLGEARFIRAYYYFLLVTRFGEVPLVTEPSPEPQPLATSEQVYSLIKADFKFAAENLPNRGQQEPGRPTDETAYGFLGKVYLFNQEYDSAMDALNQVTSYSLVPNYIDNFNVAGEYNAESLFEVGFDRRVGTQDEAWNSVNGEGGDEISFRSADYSGWSNSVPSDKMIDEYEPDDPRLEDSWFVEGATYGSSGRIWGIDADDGGTGFAGPNPVDDKDLTSKKYSDYLENDQHAVEGGTNPRILRYADIVLMKAEAELFRSGGSITQAVSYLNEVRNRPSVMMPNYGTAEMNAIYPVNTQEEVFTAIVHERMIELCLEGKRVVDLQRWGLDLQELPDVKAGYTADKRFFPIPQLEIDSNPTLGGG